MKTKAYGFTLIELMIAVAIVGILASIVYPSYMEQIRKSKRADAKAALTSFANAMEIWKMQNTNSYCDAAAAGGTNTSISTCFIGTTDTGLKDIGSPKATVFPAVVPVSSGIKTYDLTISAVTASSYTLTATPVTTDPTCGILTINETGTKTPSTAGCW